MLRLTAILMLLATGCQAVYPTPTVGEFYAPIAAAMGMVPGNPTPGPGPTPGPTPNPSTVCPNCDGRGTVGDGTIQIKCVVCDGTGKVTTEQMVKAWRNLSKEISALSKRIAAIEKPKPAPKAKPEPELAPLVWHTDIQTAKDEAARTGKPLAVHWYASWCGPCKQMDKQVFSDPNVIAMLTTKFIAVKMNIDNESQQQRRDWKVSEIPTDFVVSSDFKVGHRLPLTTDPKQYIRLLSAGVEEVNKPRREKSVIKRTSYVEPMYYEPVQYYQPVYYEPFYQPTYFGGDCRTYGGGLSSGSYSTYGGMMGGWCAGGTCVW